MFYFVVQQAVFVDKQLDLKKEQPLSNHYQLDVTCCPTWIVREHRPSRSLQFSLWFVVCFFSRLSKKFGGKSHKMEGNRSYGITQLCINMVTHLYIFILCMWTHSFLCMNIALRQVYINISVQLNSCTLRRLYVKVKICTKIPLSFSENLPFSQTLAMQNCWDFRGGRSEN